jgi:hypothetical protein
MKTLELTLVVLGAVAFAIWRGVAIYQYAFKRKNL